MKDRATDLSTLQQYGVVRMRLVKLGMVLSMMGLGLTAILAEICRTGYIPTEEEELMGVRT